MVPRDFELPGLQHERQRTFAGACVDGSRQTAPFDWGPIGSERRLIYCSLGTYQDAYAPDALLNRLVAAIAAEPNTCAIIQTPRQGVDRSSAETSDRIRFVDEAPQLQILSRATLFITHGGLSSVKEAIYYGVPMLVLPFWADQLGNASRVRHHGLGVVGDRTCSDVDRVRQWLADASSPAMRIGVANMREAFRRQSDCREGVAAVEECLEGAAVREA